MPDSKTYTGGCHCGQVRFECTTDMAMVTACNCSICTKKGLHFAFLAPTSFQLRAGEDNLKEYLFSTGSLIAREQAVTGEGGAAAGATAGGGGSLGIGSMKGGQGL